jgi:hypothetical protein
MFYYNTFCLWKHHVNLLLHLRGVSTNKKYYMFYRHAKLQRTYVLLAWFNTVFFGLVQFIFVCVRNFDVISCFSSSYKEKTYVLYFIKYTKIEN